MAHSAIASTEESSHVQVENESKLIVFFDKNGVVHSEFPRPCPSRLFLFPKVKTALKGRHHGTLDDVKKACTHALKDVSVGDFQGVYEAWKRRLQKCVHLQGAYFEDY
ncbi:histone-lysine N-methyltransferase SETMAR [Trichonephila clavipes]|nr:histone-lysine N-methyltransferase SETMAR [Trichonephila clavipes]